MEPAKSLRGLGPGVGGGREPEVVLSSPTVLPPHLAGTEHDEQVGGRSHVRSGWSKRQGEQKRRLGQVEQAYEQA
jgi:hypothetical protein